MERDTNRSTRTASTWLLPVIVLAGLTNSLSVTTSARDGESGFLAQVIAQTTRSGFAVRATRTLNASTTSGKHQGWMSVETEQSSAGQFTWTVLDEGGSERARNKVFRELLKAEAEAWRAGPKDGAALTTANYAFTPMAPSNGLLRIQLTPRREDPRLVIGTLTVSADGYPVLLEGRLAKSPSFWVKSVSIAKRFTRIGGIALPIAIESVADVRMVGQAHFAMSYAYREVNGRSVTHSPAAPAPTRAAYALTLRPGSN